MFQLQFTNDRVGGNVLIFERTRDEPKPQEPNAFNPPNVRATDEL